MLTMELCGLLDAVSQRLNSLKTEPGGVMFEWSGLRAAKADSAEPLSAQQDQCKTFKM